MLGAPLCLTFETLQTVAQPGSSAHGILQARILGWVSISFSRGSFRPSDWTWISCIRGRFFTIWATSVCLVAQSCPIFCYPMDCSSPGSSVCRDSPGRNTGVGYHALLQGILPTQESNPGLSHCRWIAYHLSHQGSPISYQESPQILYLHFNTSKISMSFKKLSLSDLISGLKYLGKMDMAAFHVYVVRCSIILK